MTRFRHTYSKRRQNFRSRNPFFLALVSKNLTNRIHSPHLFSFHYQKHTLLPPPTHEAHRSFLSSYPIPPSSRRYPSLPYLVFILFLSLRDLALDCACPPLPGSFHSILTQLHHQMHSILILDQIEDRGTKAQNRVFLSLDK